MEAKCFRAPESPAVLQGLWEDSEANRSLGHSCPSNVKHSPWAPGHQQLCRKEGSKDAEALRMLKQTPLKELHHALHHSIATESGPCLSCCPSSGQCCETGILCSHRLTSPSQMAEERMLSTDCWAGRMGSWGPREALRSHQPWRDL